MVENPPEIYNQASAFFKSVGIAAQDVIAAKLTLKNAVDKGLGKIISF